MVDSANLYSLYLVEYETAQFEERAGRDSCSSYWADELDGKALDELKEPEDQRA
jgi:hypothetical protein